MKRMMYETVHTIVFQEKEGGGNPCPITLNADGLTEEQMQNMAYEFGEECAFLMRAEQKGCDVKVRYFVPLHEMEMCIHATIGSTTVLVDRGVLTKSPIVFETHYGPVTVDWKRENGSIQVGVFQFLPRYLKENPAPEEICRALAISEDELTGGAIESVATSRFKLIVPLKRKDTLYHLKPDFEYLWHLCDKYQTTGFYPYAENTENGKSVFYARQFPKRAGYNEDPATGVAASALGAYLTKHKVADIHEGWNSFTVKQGEAMGKPSVIISECYVEQGKITKTRVRGSAKIVEK